MSLGDSILEDASSGPKNQLGNSKSVNGGTILEPCTCFMLLPVDLIVNICEYVSWSTATFLRGWGWATYIVKKDFDASARY